MTRPERRLPRLEHRPAPLGPVGQPKRDVAQVDQDAAEPTADLERHPPTTRPEADRVAEAQVDRRDLARRQVDLMKPTGDEVEPGLAGRSDDGQPAGGPAGRRPCGTMMLPRGASRSSASSPMSARRSTGSAIVPSGPRSRA